MTHVFKNLHYSNDEITVIWQPHMCTHSALCFKGLPMVFDPRRRPWVEMDKADTQIIIDQVNKCPSGALSYIKKDTGVAAQSS